MQKRTKIVATLSDIRCTPDFIKELMRAGVDVFRLNTAHQSPEGAARVIDILREVAPTAGILVDTKGPEIRTSRNGETLTVKRGEAVKVYGDPEGVSGAGVLYLSSRTIVHDVPLGSSLLIDDGELELVVTGKTPEALICFAQSDGVIKNRKSVNIPNVPVDLPALSEKDRAFIKMAASKGVDFIAHSFVRTRKDVLEVQALLDSLGSHAKVIAKIENQQGVDNIDAILDHAYGIMVARGDLGIEIPGERVPEVQRMIVEKCVESKKPVIIATQMLHSMIENPRPTRAEISDVASAIYQRSDAIMLSGETAYGRYPVEAVQTMSRIAREIEQHLPQATDQRLHRVQNVITETLARSAVRACATLPIKAIVIDTLSGRTARYLAAFRGVVPIYAICYRPEVMRRLSLSYGVEAFCMEKHSTRDAFITNAMTELLQREAFKPEDQIAIIGGSFGPSNGATFMEISQAKNIIAKPGIHHAE